MSGLARTYATKLAKQKAMAATNSDADWQSESWVDSVFDSIQKDDRSIDVWHHLDTLTLPRQIGTFYIDRLTIRRAAQEYIEVLPWLRDRHFDWLLADTLTYAELDATLLHYDKSKLLRLGPGGSAGLVLARAAWTTGKWLVWLALMVLFFAWSPWLAGAWTGLTLLIQVPKYKAKRERAALLRSMLSVYTALNSSTLSWSVVWDLMTKSRDLGAVWDPELYKLVELRK